jgi:zinc D-Ala-D-Ala carboxypeptidase
VKYFNSDTYKNKIAYHVVLWIIALIVAASLVYGGVVHFQLRKKNTELTEVKGQLEASLKITEENVRMLQDEKQKLADELDEKDRKLKKVSKTVEKLEKLTETDPELLRKYSKVYFLNEHYVPIGLEKIDTQFTYPNGRTIEVHEKVAPFLDDLLREAHDDGVPLLVTSGYRSFDTQKNLKSNYATTYGAGTANSFIADQGYSEHQLGTAIDFTTKEVGGAEPGFVRSPAYEWLQKNAYKYGFVISYPQNNAYYMFEPWHWRFVGVSLARRLHKEGKFFYDMDQREIDSYLVKIFD